MPVRFGWAALLRPMPIALLELVIDPACSIAFENETAEPARRERQRLMRLIFVPSMLRLAIRPSWSVMKA